VTEEPRPDQQQLRQGAVRPPRPKSLVVALLVAWFIGLGTLQEGYLVAKLVNDPLSADRMDLAPAVRDALLTSLQLHAEVALPVGVAQLLIGGCLVALCAASLFGARISPNLLLQVVGANVALAIATFFLAAPLREALLQGMLSTPEFQKDAEALGATSPELLYRWVNRLNLMLHVGALSLTGLALTRPAARRFMTYRAPSQHEG
jgi:hypothetical protein